MNVAIFLLVVITADGPGVHGLFTNEAACAAHRERIAAEMGDAATADCHPVTQAAPADLEWRTS